MLVRCYMNLWGVAVLELDSYTDHNKEPEHAPLSGCKKKRFEFSSVDSSNSVTCLNIS